MRTAGELKGGTIEAMDGDIGSVQDLYFDDHSWTVRYVVVDTGAWLPGRQVLISPFAFQMVPEASRLRTSLTKKQIENSPSLDTDRPVNRQREVEFAQYYGYPYYWGGPNRWGALAYPELPLNPPQPSSVDEEMLAREREGGDPNLRSARDVMGYYISASDGDLGHVEDFLVDDETWGVRYMVVDPRNWWPGHHVIVPTEWITAVHWNDSTVEVDVDKEAVRTAPRYDPSVVLDRDYEARYHESFGRSGYWERRPESWKRYPPAA